MYLPIRSIRRIVALPFAFLFAVACTEPGVMGPDQELAFNRATLGTPAGSLGQVTLGAEVGWVASTAADGEFITAESQGVVIGLRAMQRFVGLLEVTGDQGDRVGVYEASIGRSDPSSNNGTWNYDWHVDVSGATGRAAGKTLADYKLVLEQDFTEQSLFGELHSDPVLLPMVDELGDPPGVCHASSTLSRCQQSWNPGFGNHPDREESGEGAAYDPSVARTYNLRLVLTPETFNGPTLAVVIRVNVTDDG